jgi:hypothetical protein
MNHYGDLIEKKDLSYTQVIFKIIEDERGYQVKHYEALGYNRNTIRNWLRGYTSPTLDEMENLLKNIKFSPIDMLKKVARYEYNRSRETA